MKTRIMWILLLVSIAFNSAFLGALGYRLWNRKNQPPIKKIVICSPEEMPVILEELKPDQLKEIIHHRIQFEPKVQGLQRELQTARNDLVEMVVDSSPDTNRIYQQVEKVGQYQTRIEKEVVRQLIKEKSLLDPKQKAHFHQMVIKHLRKDDPFTMPCQGKEIHTRIIHQDGTIKDNITILQEDTL